MKDSRTEAAAQPVSMTLVLARVKTSARRPPRFVAADGFADASVGPPRDGASAGVRAEWERLDPVDGGNAQLLVLLSGGHGRRRYALGASGAVALAGVVWHAPG